MQTTGLSPLTQEINWKLWTGLPWKMKGRTKEGMDCWGLIHCFYKEELDIWIEPYLGQGYDGDYRNTQPVAQNIKENEIEPKFVKIDNPQPTDIVLLLIMNAPVHVGIYQRPGHFLHATQQGTVIVNDWKWKNRIEGYYRHKSLMGC